MTYLELFNLKFQRGFSTQTLLKRYPDATNQIIEIALLDVDEATLSRIVSEAKTLKQLIHLKRKFLYGRHSNVHSRKDSRRLPFFYHSVN